VPRNQKKCWLQKDQADKDKEHDLASVIPGRSFQCTELAIYPTPPAPMTTEEDRLLGISRRKQTVSILACHFGQDHSATRPLL